MRTVRGYVCGPDEDWRDALVPEFWHGATGRLQVGDRIEVHSFDHTVQFLRMQENRNPSITINNLGLLNCRQLIQPH